MPTLEVINNYKNICRVSYLNEASQLRRRYYPHFIGEEIEAQSFTFSWFFLVSFS